MRFIYVACLLVLYISANTQIDFLHQIIHPDEAGLVHSAGQEENACHRATFHGEQSACNHEFHLGKSVSCNLQHTLCPSDQICFTSDRPVFISFTALANADYNPGLPCLDSSVTFLRGPPQQSPTFS